MREKKNGENIDLPRTGRMVCVVKQVVWCIRLGKQRTRFKGHNTLMVTQHTIKHNENQKKKMGEKVDLPCTVSEGVWNMGMVTECMVNSSQCIPQ